jgi:hypothetical protein
MHTQQIDIPRPEYPRPQFVREQRRSRRLWPEQVLQEMKTVREPAEAILSQLMVPDRPLPADQADLLKRLLLQTDFDDSLIDDRDAGIVDLGGGGVLVPAPLERIDAQYEAGRPYVEQTITWEYGHFLGRQQVGEERYQEFCAWNRSA